MIGLKIVGGLLIAFGLVDLIGGYTGLDVWGEWLNITLPEALWKISPYLEIVGGWFLFKLSGKSQAAPEDTPPEA
ncbi:MAG: hypothetical protein AAF571_03015 [Verrucomicrobiota bacterium]